MRTHNRTVLRVDCGAHGDVLLVRHHAPCRGTMQGHVLSCNCPHCISANVLEVELDFESRHGHQLQKMCMLQCAHGLTA